MRTENEIRAKIRLLDRESQNNSLTGFIHGLSVGEKKSLDWVLKGVK